MKRNGYYAALALVAMLLASLPARAEDDVPPIADPEARELLWLDAGEPAPFSGALLDRPALIDLASAADGGETRIEIRQAYETLPWWGIAGIGAAGLVLGFSAGVLIAK